MLYVLKRLGFVALILAATAINLTWGALMVAGRVVSPLAWPRFGYVFFGLYALLVVAFVFWDAWTDWQASRDGFWDRFVPRKAS